MSYTREYIEQTLLHLQRILQRHLELMDLHTYNTEEKMMGKKTKIALLKYEV